MPRKAYGNYEEAMNLEFLDKTSNVGIRRFPNITF